MSATTSHHKIVLIIILGLLTAVGPFSIDMYLPAFPEISSGLQAPISKVMLSLSSYFIGISAGQFLYGPLLERFGRKRPIYAGLLLYLVATLGCALSSTVDMLIVFRFFQAVGGCAGLVASRAIVRDLFAPADLPKIFSSLMLVVAVSPIIAPTAGGYVTAIWGWRAVFVVLLIINLLTIAGVFWLLPETKSPDPFYSLKSSHILPEFRSILTHPEFATYAVSGAIAYAGLHAYISGSPNVFMNIFGVNEKQYGWIFAVIASGIIGANQLNTLALKRFNSIQIIGAAMKMQVAVAILLAMLTFFNWANLFTTVALIFLFVSCIGFIFPNTSGLSLTPFGKGAGNASALMGAIQMGSGACASALVSLLHANTAIPMTVVMAVCALVAISVLRFVRSRINAIKQEESNLATAP